MTEAKSNPNYSEILGRQFPNLATKRAAERKHNREILRLEKANLAFNARVEELKKQKRQKYKRSSKDKAAAASTSTDAANLTQLPAQAAGLSLTPLSTAPASPSSPPQPARQIDPQEIRERTIESAAKGDEGMAELIKKFGFDTSKNLLPDNWLGLRAFYNMILAERKYTVPKHVELLLAALADDRIKQLLIVISPGAGKSLCISTIYPAFKLGQIPSHTILGISAGENLMQGFQLAIMEWVEHSTMWRNLFPAVRPDKDKGWSTERGMFVTGHREGDPDASFFATGIRSKALTGKHAKLLICDDIHDNENSASAEACLGVRDTYYRQLIGRADPEGARFIFAGRRWHEEDLYGHLKSTGEWVVMELPALRAGSDMLFWDVTVPAGLKCCFTDASISAKLDMKLP